MSVLYSLEWVAESAVKNLLVNTTSVQNFYISDDKEIRVRPCVEVQVINSEERKIGRLATSSGGYLSGVFNLTVQVMLEQKADLVIKPSQNGMPEEESSKLWQEIWQAFHWDTLLSDRLTSSTSYPFTCYDARISDGAYTVDTYHRIWQKRANLQLICINRRDI